MRAGCDVDARRQKALDRAVKFRRQATSQNEHEADVARRRLDEIRAQHGIADAEIDECIDASERVWEDAGPLSNDFWQVRVALALADRIGCRAVRKGDRLVFEGSPRRTKRAAAAYIPIVRDVENGCEGVYASYGHPPIFVPVLKPILLEEAARAVAERVLGHGQPKRFPVPLEPQQELLAWSRGATGSVWCAQMHMDWARRDGRTVGRAVNLGEIG